MVGQPAPKTFLPARGLSDMAKHTGELMRAASNHRSIRRVLTHSVLASLVLLAGCASTISARVTTYQHWPEDAAGATYRIVPEPAQVNNLQFQTFSDAVRAAIGRTGLVEAQAGQPARFDVSFVYGNPTSQIWVRQYNDPFFYNGFGPAYGTFGGYYGTGAWGGGIVLAPSVVTVPVDVYKNSLMVTIKDNQQNGAEVYRSTAVSMTGANDLPAIMPLLARAVFDGFPGNNGQTRDLTYERRPR